MVTSHAHVVAWAINVFPYRFLKLRHATASAAVNLLNNEHLSGEPVSYKTSMGVSLIVILKTARDRDSILALEILSYLTRGRK